MNSMVDSLLDQYDRGLMTRRNLVQELAALVLPTSSLAQDGARASGPIVRGLCVNHVALTVSDVPRSFAFYGIGDLRIRDGQHLRLPLVGDRLYRLPNPKTFLRKERLQG
jgi:hypothetical protein